MVTTSVRTAAGLPSYHARVWVLSKGILESSLINSGGASMGGGLLPPAFFVMRDAIVANTCIMIDYARVVRIYLDSSKDMPFWWLVRVIRVIPSSF